MDTNLKEMGSQDLELVNEFLMHRSESSFRNLYQAYTPRLYQMAFRLSGRDERAAEELIQDTWIRAIRKLESFKHKSSLLTWLIGILININRERFKSQIKEKVFEDLSTLNSATTIENRIDAMDLEKAIETLPNGYRQILILHDVEGFKHKDIGEMLDISEGTSKSQLFQARKALRKFLNDM